jgi:hypothetical protein
MVLTNIFPGFRVLLAFSQACCTHVQRDLRHNDQSKEMAMELAARPWITAGVALVLPTLQQVIADLLDGNKSTCRPRATRRSLPSCPAPACPR